MLYIAAINLHRELLQRLFSSVHYSIEYIYRIDICMAVGCDVAIAATISLRMNFIREYLFWIYSFTLRSVEVGSQYFFFVLSSFCNTLRHFHYSNRIRLFARSHFFIWCIHKIFGVWMLFASIALSYFCFSLFLLFLVFLNVTMCIFELEICSFCLNMQ